VPQEAVGLTRRIGITVSDADQHDIAKAAGKVILSENIFDSPDATEAESPLGLWRDNEELQWNPDLAGWEYSSDGAMLFCSRLDQGGSLQQFTARD
jgi:hypothetical protein